MSPQKHSSRLPGFYELSLHERTRIVAAFSDLTTEDSENLCKNGNLSHSLADTFIENAIGTYSMPFGVATNFLINGKDYLIPMVVEESSVIAAASHGAKLVRKGGGFKATSTDPIMTGQIQLFLKNRKNVDEVLNKHKETLINYANQGQNRLIERQGGAKDISWYEIKELECVVFLLHVHTCDAMGANIVNTMCEKLSHKLQNLFPDAQIGLRILTNLTLQRRAEASCKIPFTAFDANETKGKSVAEGIYKAFQFAWYDIFRATTHNKGVMNGIDPVIIATGNDWRAAEAAAHAFACKNGRYRPITKWSLEKDHLAGSINIPMAVGTVGGVTKLHPLASIALKILANPNAKELAEIICCVGLAQNLSALKALATEGIQRGHMSLHEKNIQLLNSQIT